MTAEYLAMDASAYSMWINDDQRKPCDLALIEAELRKACRSMPDGKPGGKAGGKAGGKDVQKPDEGPDGVPGNAVESMAGLRRVSSTMVGSSLALGRRQPVPPRLSDVQ